jgi:cell wall-associated NlpC family hydrolase
VTLKYQHLVGREFTGIGRQDCFDLGIAFFRDNFDIVVPNFARPHDWQSDKLDLISKVAPLAGFDRIDEWKPKDLRPADVLCLAIGEAKPNHFAIYLGDDLILHHLFGRRSDTAPFRDIWRTRTAYVLRHPDVPDLRPVYPDVDLQDIINARNAPPTR